MKGKGGGLFLNGTRWYLSQFHQRLFRPCVVVSDILPSCRTTRTLLYFQCLISVILRALFVMPLPHTTTGPRCIARKFGSLYI